MFLSIYSLATLVHTGGTGQTFQVRSGESFRLTESTEYKLVDVSEEKATIENASTKEKHEVHRADLSAPAADSAAQDQSQ